ncbi:MAG: RdgB/HAM1 family non-canonical purine NTP pyrophosphatase [Cyclobacteriaceae bacterium]
MTICFASHNENKVREISELSPDGIEIIGLNEIGITEEIEETGSTLEENSRIKARYVFDSKRIPVFADDSGLEVTALGGAPGVISARYAGPERDNSKNIALVLKNLQAFEDRSARFRSVITFIDQDGAEVQFEGMLAGQLQDHLRGSNGFGYDPIFVPDGFDRTFAEMAAEEKNKLSHRAKAFEKLLSYLGKLNG